MVFQGFFQFLGDIWGVTGELLCEACLAANHLVPATTRSQTPDYTGYNLCALCAKPVEAGRVFHEACTLPVSERDE